MKNPGIAKSSSLAAIPAQPNKSPIKLGSSRFGLNGIMFLIFNLLILPWGVDLILSALATNSLANWAKVASSSSGKTLCRSESSTSIVSTSLVPFYAVMWVVFIILGFIPIVNIISGIVWLFLGTAIIIAAIVCTILAWLNFSKAKKLPSIIEGEIDPELFASYQAAQKKMKVAKILAIVATVLLALLIVLYVLYFIFAIILVLGLLGVGLFSEMQYYF